MITAGDPRARRRQHLVRVPVHLPTLAGRSGLNIWRSSTERGSGRSQSWAQESSAEGLHQLHGSIVLERGREEAGTGGDSCGGKELGKGSATCLRLALTTPATLHTQHCSPQPRCHASPHSPGGHGTQSSPPSTRAHSQRPPWAMALSLFPHQPGPIPSVRSAQRTLPQPGQAQHLQSDPKARRGFSPPLSQLPTHRNPGLIGHHASAPEAKREVRAGVVYKDDPQQRPALETGHP